MKLLLLIGDSAVGKMTVGQALAKITELRLFHNHMTIEPVIEIFGEFNGHVTKRLRDVIFEEFVKSDNYGMIFTIMWAFDMQSDWDYFEYVCGLFEAQGGEIYAAELVAPQSVRLERNRTENRLKYKASKRDIEASEGRLLRDNENHRLESLPGELSFENYIKIDTTNLSAEETAQKIRDEFGL